MPVFIKRKKPWEDIAPSEITPESVYLDRRRFMGASAALLAAAAVRPDSLRGAMYRRLQAPGQEAPQVGPVTRGEELRDELTPYEDVTSHNNFYEFGTGKRDPLEHSGDFQPEPWTVQVEGHARHTGTWAVEDLVRPDEVEDRIYRLRCVEAWSMVIPWRGAPLRNIIARLEPTSQAKYVAFETVFRPDEMPGQRRRVLDWPYREGLRIDEAAHDLTLMVTGLYGRDHLPNQNGAPLRLMVPWKYGFKSIKSIVKISFVEEMPSTSWEVSAPHEYGFFANVNPEVDHPRWSQARERRIGELRPRETLMFNGYAEQVAHLYAGMDLARWY
jgi:sulfoxide reductase catalytic subunit YedY